MKKTSIFISYYNSYPITSGSSAVTTSLFNSWPGKKKLFMMNHEANIKKKNIYNFYSPSNKPIVKIFLLIPYCIFIYFKIRKLNTKYIIFEGASWTGYILFTYIFLKIFLYKKKFIYHSHNVDFFFRQKSYIISKISFLFEKKILQNFDISTAVSIKDCKKFYQYFKVKTKVLPNGILINKKFLKKIKINTKYIIFSGSLEYEQNKKIFSKLLKNEFRILKKYIPNIKIYLTGGGKFKFYKNNHDIIELGTLNLSDYMKCLTGALAIIVPGTSSTGTKVKVIEALSYNKIVFSTPNSLRGIESKFDKFISYKNMNEFESKVKNFKNSNFKLKIFNEIGIYFRKNYDMKNILQEFYAENNL